MHLVTFRIDLDLVGDLRKRTAGHSLSSSSGWDGRRLQFLCTLPISSSSNYQFSMQFFDGSSICGYVSWSILRIFIKSDRQSTTQSIVNILLTKLEQPKFHLFSVSGNNTSGFDNASICNKRNNFDCQKAGNQIPDALMIPCLPAVAGAVVWAIVFAHCWQKPPFISLSQI